MKPLVRALAFVLVLPRYLAWWVMARLVGPDRALVGATQSLARIPGFRGRYQRAAFLRLVLEHCDPNVCVEFGAVFSQCAARLGAHVYVGPYCQIGRAHIGDDTMLSAGVQVPSGSETHGAARLDLPMRLQPGRLRTIRIGRDCWVGGGAVVMDDVGDQAIIAAGAVVTQPVRERVVVGGVPAREIRRRE